MRKGIYYYFLPTYKQATAVIWDSLLEMHLPKEIVAKKLDSSGNQMIVYTNGSIQRFAGCEDIDKHRGINAIDVVFDEYSEIDEKLWTTIIQPVLRENAGTATFIFTPKGQNHSWRLLQQAKDNPEWYTSVRTNDQTQTFSPQEIAEMKREMPEDLFQQEIMCEFLEGAGAVFKKVRENLWDAPTILPNGDWQVGIDLAKYNDWTVLTPFNLNDMRTYPQQRFNRVSYTDQKQMIRSYYDLLSKKGTAKIEIDSTGVGEPIFDDLAAGGIDVEPYRFTEESRGRLLNNLRILLEQHKIKIPNDQGLIDELSAVCYKLNANGRIKMESSTTDDRVMSLALAVWGILDKISYVSPRDIERIPYQDDKSSPWYKGNARVQSYKDTYSYK